MPRDKMITAIDLKNCLQLGVAQSEGLFIVTNFNKLDIAFHVDSVIGIHRLSWTDILTPDASVVSDSSALGIIKISGKLIVVLDFEKVVADINPDSGLRTQQLMALGERDRKDVPILIAEDSALLNKLIVETLNRAGYHNLIRTKNGKEAYDVIQEALVAGELDEHVKCIITDIEMPIMDGHHLTKLIKEDDATKHIPIIIFSSLVNEEMRVKGRQLGADAQISKPEILDLINVLDDLVLK